ncbi:hypothetical protein [Aurantiacibacter sp. D1-12]|uniref:hypothetical protein n=1 Tax=Aurantiacibacter sp. D1-12 TaxID=2993658 RepID=UPI00237D1B2C|nr:hypothetical protein [Aurantiacibacter sp. D1-12]MDE1466892.1 hypothetical protein [Aurantiacibacter sp. D1-12]
MNPKVAKLKSSVFSVMMRNYLRSETRRQGNMVITGFPKSGTTWVSQVVASYLGLDYRRNDVRFQTRGALLHTHSIDFAGGSNVIYVARDPREAICSAARAASAAGEQAVFDNEGKILPSFVEATMASFPGATTSMKRHYAACVEREWPLIRFEDLKQEPMPALSDALSRCAKEIDCARLQAALDEFDFTKLKAKSGGDVFLAQSSLSSWKELLPAAALSAIVREVGEEASRLGYDLD